MSRRLPASLALTAIALLVLALAPAVARADFGSVFRDYQSDGAISTCSHSLGDLESARGNIPSDIEQYAPDFPAALDSAIAGHGKCGHKTSGSGGGSTGGSGSAGGGGSSGGSGGSSPSGAGSTGGGAGAAGSGTASPRVPTPHGGGSALTSLDGNDRVGSLASVGDSGSSIPLPILMLAVAAAMALAAAGVWATRRYMGWGWGPLAPVGHAFEELGSRAEGALSGFAERLPRVGSRGGSQ